MRRLALFLFAAAAALAQTTTWTSATTQNTALTTNVAGYYSMNVSVVCTSTITAGVVTFEGSDDGSNFYGLTFTQTPVSGAGQASSGNFTLVANSGTQFRGSLAGNTTFRSRLSTAITGTGACTITQTPLTVPYPPENLGIWINNNTSNGVPSIAVGAGTFNANQQAVTNTAAALPTNNAKSVCVEVLSSSTASAFVGASGVTTGTGMEIPPGQGNCWNINNTNLVFVIAAASGTTTVTFTWTN